MHISRGRKADQSPASARHLGESRHPDQACVPRCDGKCHPAPHKSGIKSSLSSAPLPLHFLSGRLSLRGFGTVCNKDGAPGRLVHGGQGLFRVKREADFCLRPESRPPTCTLILSKRAFRFVGDVVRPSCWEKCDPGIAAAVPASELNLNFNFIWEGG